MSIFFDIFLDFFFHYILCWLYPLCIMSQYYEIRSIDSSFFFLTMACVVCEIIMVAYTLYSCTLFLDVQYPTLTLYSTFITFIYL
jgi:hypothetical protein